MGLSSRSKRLQRNRAARRVNYYPKELKRLKETLSFKWDEKRKVAHLSLFHDFMNGPPPQVPGLEEGSGIERLHLTQTNVSADRNEGILKRKMVSTVTSATRALDKNFNKVKEEKKESESEVKRLYDEKSMKDQFGKYAPWLSQKAVKKLVEEEREGRRKAKRLARRTVRRVPRKRSNQTTASKDVEMEEVKK